MDLDLSIHGPTQEFPESMRPHLEGDTPDLIDPFRKIKGNLVRAARGLDIEHVITVILVLTNIQELDGNGVGPGQREFDLNTAASICKLQHWLKFPVKRLLASDHIGRTVSQSVWDLAKVSVSSKDGRVFMALALSAAC